LTDLSIIATETSGGQIADALVTGEAEGIIPVSKSPAKLALRRFLRHKVALVSLIVLCLVTLAVIFAPVTARYPEDERLTTVASNGTVIPAINLSPRAEAWFGTDEIGHDLYSRIIWGGRVSLFIGIAVAVSAAVVGTIVGSLAGYRGGMIDDALMRVTDLFLAFPLLVALLVMRNLFAELEWMSWLFGELSSIRFMVVLLTFVAWMATARIVRGTVLSLKEREFVEAARALGAPDRRVIMRHLIPNSLGPIVVAMTTTVAAAILTEATLSFFGYGVSEAQGKSSWGNLLADADGAITTQRWWLAVFPSLALIITVLTINFVGDGLRDAFDPKQRRART
jgi:peptide/nickel transport system permease protein